MDFPTIYKKFYYCLHQTTLYVKVILLKACFKYEKAYIKNCFFKDFTGRVHFARVTSFLLPPPDWSGYRHATRSSNDSVTRPQELDISAHCIELKKFYFVDIFGWGKTLI